MKPSTTEYLTTTIQRSEEASSLDLQITEEIDEAINLGNVFCILGSNALVREALRKRGWVELFFNFPKRRQPRRIPLRLKLLEECEDSKSGGEISYPESLLNKIASSAYRYRLPSAPSYLHFNPFAYLTVINKKIVIPWEDEGGKYAKFARRAENSTPRLLWVSRFFQVDLHCQQLKDCFINIFSDSTSICNKAGICRVLKRLPSILNQDPSTFFPRSYNLACEDERQDFIDDFRKTACVSVVRYIIECRNNKCKRVMVDSGKESRNKISVSNSAKEDRPFDSPTSENEEITNSDSLFGKFDMVKKYDKITSPMKGTADTEICTYCFTKEPSTENLVKETKKEKVAQIEMKEAGTMVGDGSVISNTDKATCTTGVDKSTNTSYLYTRAKRSNESTSPLITDKTTNTSSSSDTELSTFDLERVVNEATMIKEAISSHVMNAAAALGALGSGGDTERQNMTRSKISPKIQYEEMKATTPMPSSFIKVAIHQCHRMLNEPKHSEIDGELDPDELSKDEWDTFLHHFYQMSRYSIDYKELSDIVDECESLLEKLRAQRQQFLIDGYKNIWIMKPKGSSRGRGIFCYSNIDQVLHHIVPSDISDVFGNKLMVQKYVERPLLIYNTKVDIRQYFLVTDWNRLTVWWYNDFYLRFCSQQFTLQDFNKSVHVSNHTIQMRYKNGARSPLLPEENMWDRENFYHWLTDRGDFKKWKSKTVPAMKHAILAVLRCGQENFTNPRRKSFQLYGADFIIDEEYKPWLLEINGMPALTKSTAVAGRIALNVIEDTLKTVFDKGSKKDTGQFDLLYRQPPFMPCPRTNCETLQVMGRSIRVPPSVVNRPYKLDIPEPPDSPPTFCSPKMASPEIPLKTTKRLTPVIMNKRGHVVVTGRAKPAAQRSVEKKRTNFRSSIGSNTLKSDVYKRKVISDSAPSMKSNSIIPGKQSMHKVVKVVNKANHRYSSIQDYGKIEGMALSISKLSPVPGFNAPLDTSPSGMVNSLLWVRKMKCMLNNTRQ